MTASDATCRACGAALEADDVAEAEAGLGIVRCRACRALTRVGARGGAPAPLPRPAVERPGAFSIEETVTGFRLVRRWFVGTAVVLAFFAFVWCSILYAWYAGTARGPQGAFFALLGLPFLAVGVFLAYFTLALFVNRTVILLDRGTLSVRHGPLPWGGNVALDAADVAQISCELKVWGGSQGRGSSAVRVNATLKDGRRVRILSAARPEHALYVEQALEQRLGIRDRPVPGELPR